MEVAKVAPTIEEHKVEFEFGPEGANAEPVITTVPHEEKAAFPEHPIPEETKVPATSSPHSAAPPAYQPEPAPNPEIVSSASPRPTAPSVFSPEPAAPPVQVPEVPEVPVPGIPPQT